MTGNFFVEQLKQRLEFMPKAERDEIISSYEEKLFNVKSADEEEALLKDFGSIDSIVRKYQREHEITDIASTSQSELPSFNATADIKSILDSSSIDGTASDFLNKKDIKVEDENALNIKTKTFSEESKANADGETLFYGADYASTNPVSSSNEEFVPSPEAEQTEFHPSIDDEFEPDDKYEQQSFDTEAKESIFSQIIKRLHISRSAAPFVFILLAIVAIPVTVIILALAGCIYAVAYAILAAVIIAVIILAIAFIAIGVLGLVNAIVTLFHSVPIGILEIGLSTIAFSIAIAVLALSYQLIFGVIVSVSKFITRKFIAVLKKIKYCILGKPAGQSDE